MALRWLSLRTNLGLKDDNGRSASGTDALKTSGAPVSQPLPKQRPGREGLWASSSPSSKLLSPAVFLGPTPAHSLPWALALWFQVEFGHRRHWQETRGREESEIWVLLTPPSPVTLAPPPRRSCWLACTLGYISLQVRTQGSLPLFLRACGE